MKQGTLLTSMLSYRQSALRNQLAKIGAGIAAILLSLTLVACGGNNATIVVREGLSGEFEDLKTKGLDKSDISWVVDGLTEIKVTGIDQAELLRAWMGDFDYKLGDFKVENGFDWVEVPVTITTKPLGPALQQLVDEFEAEHPEGFATATSNGNSPRFARLIEILDATAPTTSEQTIVCTKLGGSWQVGTDNNLYTYLYKYLIGTLPYQFPR